MIISSVLVILNKGHQKLCIILLVAHLNSGAFIRKCVVNYNLTALVCKVITLIVGIKISWIIEIIF